MSLLNASSWTEFKTKFSAEKYQACSVSGDVLLLFFLAGASFEFQSVADYSEILRDFPLS